MGPGQSMQARPEDRADQGGDEARDLRGLVLVDHAEAEQRSDDDGEDAVDPRPGAFVHGVSHVLS